MGSKKRRMVSAASVFIAALVFYTAGMDTRPISTRGEGREALVVQAMEQQHNLVLPRRNGATVPSKPPLFHWLAYGASRALGGITEFTVRLPSAVCGAAALAAVFVLFMSLRGPVFAFSGALLLASTFEWSRSAGHARVDMCFSLFLILAHVGWFLLLSGREKGSSVTGAAILAFAGTTGAILAKGPAGLVLPAAGAAVYFVIRSYPAVAAGLRRFPYFPALGVIAASVIFGSIWYFLAYREGGQDFVAVQLLKENFGRVVEMEGEDVGHKQPFFFSIIHLLLGFLPWSLFVPVFAVWAWKKRTGIIKDDFTLYSLVWAALYVAAVSVSVSKRTVYLLPAYPAVAFLLLRAIEEMCGPAGSQLLRCYSRVCVFAGACLALAAGAACFVLLLLGGARLAAEFPQYAPLLERPVLLFLAFGLFAAAAACFICCRRLKHGLAVQAVALFSAGVLVVVLLVNSLIMPVDGEAKSPKKFMEAAARSAAGRELLQYRHDFYPAVFYAKRVVPFVGKCEELPRHRGALIIAAEKEAAEVLACVPGAVVLDKSETKAANGKERLVLVEL